MLIIGEGPGATEVVMGRPFVGVAGQLLRRTLLLGVEHKVFISNLVACRPLQGSTNRPPTDHEVAVCHPRLKALIAILRPQMIIALGRCPQTYLMPQAVRNEVSAQSLLEPDIAPLASKGCVSLPLYHPSFICRRGGEAARIQDPLVDNALIAYEVVRQVIAAME